MPEYLFVGDARRVFPHLRFRDEPVGDTDTRGSSEVDPGDPIFADSNPDPVFFDPVEAPAPKPETAPVTPADTTITEA